jgi:hypothetical protein
LTNLESILKHYSIPSLIIVVHKLTFIRAYSLKKEEVSMSKQENRKRKSESNEESNMGYHPGVEPGVYFIYGSDQDQNVNNNEEQGTVIVMLFFQCTLTPVWYWPVELYR